MKAKGKRIWEAPKRMKDILSAPNFQTSNGIICSLDYYSEIWKREQKRQKIRTTRQNEMELRINVQFGQIFRGQPQSGCSLQWILFRYEVVKDNIVCYLWVIRWFGGNGTKMKVKTCLSTLPREKRSSPIIFFYFRRCFIVEHACSQCLTLFFSLIFILSFESIFQSSFCPFVPTDRLNTQLNIYPIIHHAQFFFQLSNIFYQQSSIFSIHQRHHPFFSLILFIDFNILMSQDLIIFMSDCSVLQTLLWKNFLIVKANRYKYLIIYISPLVLLLLAIFLQIWTDELLNFVNPNPPQKHLNPIPKCVGEGCLTLGVIYSGMKEPYMDTVLSYIRKANNFSQEDIKELPIPAGEIINHLSEHPNKTQSILMFCSNSSIRVGDLDIPCYAQDYHLNFYTIIYNLSLFHRVPYLGDLKTGYPKDYVTVKLKYDIDRGIISHYNPNAEVDFTFSDFPSQTSRFLKGVSVIAQYGSLFIILPYLALLVMEGGRLLVQKEKRLRIGLNIVGVTHLQFYLSQILTYYIHVVIISVSFCFFGYILKFKIWTNGIILFDFYILTTNGFVLGLLALCVTAAVAQRSLGMSILYGFILYSFVMQWMFTGGYLFDMLYFTNASFGVLCLRVLFNLYPSFHFSKLINDISRKADSHMDTFQNRFVEGTEFTWDDIFIRQSKSYQKPFPQTYILPSPLESALYLLLTSISFIIILWILDNFVESNRGYKENVLPCNRQERRQSMGYEQEFEQNMLVRITNLQKVYNNKHYALNGVTASLNKGEIVALLGENGAGKSTLINILIGALAKTRGEASIEGISVDKDITSIRKIIGVCPQFDILWEELTAGQHIELFHKLKHLEISNQGILDSLESVGLEKNVNGQVSTFSGGMRRRTSLALSLIGGPKLVILDEPTTGMDAKVRLQTWKLILGLRLKHTVLITTHNMQEAECVSDRIMIMSKGRVIAQGTALQLKKQYGQGYVIRGYNRAKSEDVVIKCKEVELQGMLKELQKGDIENWSLHQTTLEEVFLNVSNRY